MTLPIVTTAATLLALCGPLGGATAAPSDAGIDSGFQRPPVIRFGATVAEMQKVLDDACQTLDTRVIDPPFLPDVREEQMQIDCDGFEFRERPRWAEFIFRDDSLVMVWILTSAEEEAEILEAMTQKYGQPTHQGDDNFAFVDNLTALRRDKPEVLFYSEVLAATYRAWFDENLGQSAEE